MIPESKDLEKIDVHQVYIVSKIEFDNDPARIDAHAEASIIHNMAEWINRHKVTKVFSENRVEYRLDLMVCTPEEFWKLVNERVEYLARRYKG
jgi:hypothetical protein